MPLHELYDPSKGFLVNDTLLIEADVNAPKVVDYWSHDSKKETGFVGLKNQGATCYMNSLLQTLYHLPYFRKVLIPRSFSCTVMEFAWDRNWIQRVLHCLSCEVLMPWNSTGRIPHAYN
jgi:ubiquitin C-terminal hydrolase